MIDSSLTVRALANTPSNLKTLSAIGESRASNEYHIFRNETKFVLITHYTWDSCPFCNADTGDTGIVDMR